MLSYLGSVRAREDLQKDLQTFRRDLEMSLRAYSEPRRQEIAVQCEASLSTITDCLAAWSPNSGPTN
jgi:hypothetical protein